MNKFEYFLCVGPWAELEFLYNSLKRTNDLRSTLIRQNRKVERVARKRASKGWCFYCDSLFDR